MSIPPEGGPLPRGRHERAEFYLQEAVAAGHYAQIGITSEPAAGRPVDILNGKTTHVQIAYPDELLTTVLPAAVLDGHGAAVLAIPLPDYSFRFIVVELSDAPADQDPDPDQAVSLTFTATAVPPSRPPQTILNAQGLVTVGHLLASIA